MTGNSLEVSWILLGFGAVMAAISTFILFISSQDKNKYKVRMCSIQGCQLVIGSSGIYFVYCTLKFFLSKYDHMQKKGNTIIVVILLLFLTLIFLIGLYIWRKQKHPITSCNQQLLKLPFHLNQPVKWRE